MKNIIKAQEIKALETAVKKATGWESVEIVVPVSMQDLPSVDYRLLEMENKLNIANNRVTPRQARKAAKEAARTDLMNKATAVVDGVLDVIAEPAILRHKVKSIGAIHDFFFMPDSYYEEDVVETPAPMQEAVPVKPQVIKEGKVVHVNFKKQ